MKTALDGDGHVGRSWVARRLLVTAGIGLFVAVYFYYFDLPVPRMEVVRLSDVGRLTPEYDGGELYRVWGRRGCDFMDETGSLVFSADGLSCRDAIDGVAECWKAHRRGYLFIETQRVRLLPQAKETHAFRDGFARFGVPASHIAVWTLKYGFVDREGNVAIPPKFDDAGDFAEGLCRVNIGATTTPRTTPVFGLWGYIDGTGDFVIEPRFERAEDFSEGLAGVEVDRSWGFVDRTGSIVIPARFQLAGEFSQSLARVRIGDYWGFIDRGGDIVIAPRFRWAGDFSEGLCPVKARDGWEGFIDASGKRVFQAAVGQGSGFSGGLTCTYVETAGHRRRWGFMNREGEMVIPARYYSAQPFRGRLARVDLEADDSMPSYVYSTPSYIDRTGREVMPADEQGGKGD